jgi:hypothetical protein
VSILGLGVIAALNQVGIATTVTTPILIAVLATIAGILIVGVGGGLVRPMQARWEAWLERAAAESSRVAERAKAYSAHQRAPENAATQPIPAQQPPVYPQTSGTQAGAADNEATQIMPTNDPQHGRRTG